VRSVDLLLQQHFHKASGLADEQTVILDPATGTGTFLNAVVDSIYETLKGQGMASYWNSYVPDKLLPRLFGFELLMAPYTIAHMKLGLLLKDQGYQFEHSERLGVYLTNALESLSSEQMTLPFAQFIAEEGRQADDVKQHQPVMVVLGNPPYSGHSENRSWKIETQKGKDGKLTDVRVPTFIGKLVHDYYFVDGKPLGERNPKWLQDDYVKFIRFGQWRISQTGEGILAFISNNGYLDNPTFRGMRQSLLHDFDTIYLLNLHGNSRKQEKSPDGSPDENVFDIQQGVTIGLLIRQPGHQPGAQATVYYADLWGERKSKYEALEAQDVGSTEWQQIEPSSPWHLLVPQDTDVMVEYEQGWSISDICEISTPGVVTGQDKKTIAFDRSTAEFQADSCGVLNRAINLIAYRPFDYRCIVYDGAVVTRTRFSVMRHMQDKNVGIVTVRRSPPGNPCNYYMATQHMISNGMIRSDNQSIDSLFPLYLYPEEGDMFAADERRPNLSDAFIKDITERLGLAFKPDGSGDLAATVGPEDIFHYIYAVFHSPTYRERYAEFLKIDFPRVPLTRDRALFAALAAKGAALVDLHLLRLPGAGGVGGAGGAEVLQNPGQQGLSAPEQGNNLVDKVRYVAPQGDQAGRVYFNKDQYFAGIEPETWEMHIGGYQPLEKWLKDRKGRTLEFDDVRHYLRVVIALRETRRLMGEIDGLIPGWPLE
jgi:predicted helicase